MIYGVLNLRLFITYGTKRARKVVQPNKKIVQQQQRMQYSGMCVPGSQYALYEQCICP